MCFKNSLELEGYLNDILPKGTEFSVNRNLNDDFVVRVEDFEFIFDHRWYLDEFHDMVNEILEKLESNYIFLWWKN